MSAPAKPSDFGPFSVQRALGVVWDSKANTLSPSVLTEVRPFTKYDVLATVNGLQYNATGHISPVMFKVKLVST